MNLEQIRVGLAWHYMKHEGEQSTAERVRYSDAEREARRVKRGLWHDANPVLPWDYCQAKRELKNQCGMSYLDIWYRAVTCLSMSSRPAFLTGSSTVITGQQRSFPDD